jgi:hypothetical protein
MAQTRGVPVGNFDVSTVETFDSVRWKRKGEKSSPGQNQIILVTPVYNESVL